MFKTAKISIEGSPEQIHAILNLVSKRRRKKLITITGDVDVEVESRAAKNLRASKRNAERAEKEAERAVKDEAIIRAKSEKATEATAKAEATATDAREAAIKAEQKKIQDEKDDSYARQKEQDEMDKYDKGDKGDLSSKQKRDLLIKERKGNMANKEEKKNPKTK